jgi:hypothetical protein
VPQKKKKSWDMEVLRHWPLLPYETSAVATLRQYQKYYTLLGSSAVLDEWKTVSNFKITLEMQSAKYVCIHASKIQTNNKLSKAVKVVEYRELKGEEGQF